MAQLDSSKVFGNLTVTNNLYGAKLYSGGTEVSVITHTHNNLILKFDTGTTEGTDLYTYNGGTAKTIDFKSGTNVTLTDAAGSVTFSSPSLSLGTTVGTGNAITDIAVSGHQITMTKGTTFLTSSSGVTTWSAGDTGLTPNTGTSGAVTMDGVLNTVHGGTGLSAYTAGDMVYWASGTTFTKLSIGSAGKIIRSTGTAPAWTTATYPDSTTINQILYSSAANAITGLATANTGALVTSSTGVPSFTSGTTANRVLRTNGSAITFAQVNLTSDVTGTLPIANGGTGTTSTTQWGMVYGASATAYGTTAAGTAAQVLKSNGNAAPTWVTLDMTYLPDAVWKKSVKAATTADLGTVTATTTTLTGTTVVFPAQDGITLALNDRLLVKDQTTQAQNGIYSLTTVGVAGTTAWVLTRVSGADSVTEVAGAVVNVDSGTVNGGFLFSNNFKTTDTLGTTAMPWYRINSTFDSTSANTVNKLVLRDGSGNFSAGTITATLNGGISTTITGTGTKDLLYASIADNDYFRLRVGGTASDAGYAELATADGGNEPIYVRQYTGVFATLTRTATLLDGSGNTSFPGTVSAPTFVATSVTNGGFQGIEADTVTQPSFTWTNDLNTGMWHSAADSIGFTTNGTNRVTINNSGLIMDGTLNLNSYNISNVNNITIADPGPNEGIEWASGNLWKIYESPDNLTDNTSGNLQFVQNATRRMTVKTDGTVDVPGNINATTSTVANKFQFQYNASKESLDLVYIG